MLNMLFDDKLLATRLNDQPEFILRLHELLVTWGLIDKPGLYLQARPVAKGGAPLDVDAPAVRHALREGAQGKEHWWDNLAAPVALSSVHGVTGLVSSSPDWVSELHRDGHMLAGVWSFPEAPTRGGETLAIVDWYANFFTQFFDLMAKVAEAGSLSGDFHVTATLVNADGLRFATVNEHGNFRGVAGEKSALKNVQWLVYTAPIGTQQWAKLAIAMADGIRGAYRVRR